MSLMFSTVAEFARAELSADVIPNGDDFEVLGVTSSDNLAPGCLAFAKQVDTDLIDRIDQIENVALIVPDSAPDLNCSVLKVPHPRLAFAQIAEQFWGAKYPVGIHPSAVVDNSAEVDPMASIGPFCYIGPGCRVGARTVFVSHVTLTRNVQIGDDCVLWSHAACGDDGFGIEKLPGQLQRRIPHLGGVIIGNGVHIGTMSVIVAGTIEPTRIGDGSMVDNHVHVAHNVQVGRNCQLIACVEVSGSVKIGDNVTLGPNSSVIQKVTIGDNSVLGIGTVVIKSVPENVVVAGVPARILRSLPQRD